MNPFDFYPRTRLILGNGSLDRIGELVVEYSGSRVLLVSDPGIQGAGYVDRAEKLIRDAGAHVFTFTDVEENPTTRHVRAATDFARGRNVDFIVGLGGGSSMDCAKGANFILTNGGDMRDYRGIDRATRPMLPMIAIPTTAGTGSEAQSFALITDEETHAKMACGDKKAACKVALLDPELTLSQPRDVAAITGMDAISHAIESYVTTRRNPISQMLSRRACSFLIPCYPKIFENPADLEARGSMLFGACLAGLAIENSMLGATHACANPLTARYGITHGIAIGVMLPHVIRRNAEGADSLYLDLFADCLPRLDSKFASHGPLLEKLTEAMESGKISVEALSVDVTAFDDDLARIVEKLRDFAKLPARLSDLDVDEDRLPELAKEAAQQWTAQFNPVSLNETDFLDLYQTAY